MTAKPYRPSNGTEGWDFREQFCLRCVKDLNEDCPILNDTLLYEVSNPKYPKQCIQDEQGPRCTAFEKRGEE